MSSTVAQPRTPRGVPAGGRFATATADTADVELAAAAPAPPNANAIERAERFAGELPAAYLAAEYAPHGRLTPAFGTFDARHGRVLVTGSADGSVRAEVGGHPYEPNQLRRWRDRRLRHWIDQAKRLMMKAVLWSVRPETH